MGWSRPSPGGNIGCDQNVDLAVGEPGERLFAGDLTTVTVNRLGGHVLFGQLAREAICAVLGPAEHQGTIRVPSDLGDDLGAVHLVHGDEAMCHLIDGDALGFDLAAHRVLLVALGEPVDDAIERCREQQGLVVTLDVTEHPLDLREEPHVGHAIGFVDNHVGDVVEEHFLAFDQVDQASGGRDHKVDPLGQVLDLLFDVRAAVDGENAPVECVGHRQQLVLDLRRQLSGGDKGQRSRSLGFGDIDQLQDREAKRQGLAGAGLGLATDVVAFERRWNGEFLDLEGVLEALALERIDDLGQQAQVSEFFGHVKSNAVVCRMMLWPSQSCVQVQPARAGPQRRCGEGTFSGLLSCACRRGRSVAVRPRHGAVLRALQSRAARGDRSMRRPATTGVRRRGDAARCRRLGLRPDCPPRLRLRHRS